MLASKDSEEGESFEAGDVFDPFVTKSTQMSPEWAPRTWLEGCQEFAPRHSLFLRYPTHAGSQGPTSPTSPRPRSPGAEEVRRPPTKARVEFRALSRRSTERIGSSPSRQEPRPERTLGAGLGLAEEARGPSARQGTALLTFPLLLLPATQDGDAVALPH